MNKIGDIDLHQEGGMRILADGGAWIKCGELYSRKDYPELYAAIGQSYADEDKRCCNAELFVAGPEETVPIFATDK